jgi:GT2 family glycosyltransferase
MKTFVVIVTYNGAAWIRLALESLRASDSPCVTVVIDNASTDDTVEIIGNEFPEVLLLPQSNNTGFGVGNNIGISHAINAGADCIFLLNQDAFVTSSALGELTSFLQLHSEYAVVTPLHCSPDLNCIDPQTQRRYLQGYAPQYLSDACLGSVKEYYDIYGINAAAWMVRADAFKLAGGFDPLFFMYGEDDDLISRFNHHGQKFALLPATKIVHLRAKSARPKVGVYQEIWALSERARSNLLLDAKSLNGSVIGKSIRLFVDGIGQPLLKVFVSHNWRECIAYFFATFRIIFRAKSVIRSSKRCTLVSPHYLSINGFE